MSRFKLQLLLAAGVWLSSLLPGCAAADPGKATEDDAVGMVDGGLPQTPSFAPRTWVRILENRGFTLGYSELRRNPLWVTYQVRRIRRRKPYRRPEGFEVDRRTWVRVDPADYTRSGYQRGHLAPSWLVAQLYGREAQRQTFLMSNITPQRPNLNQKLWQRLEEIESDRFVSQLGKLWVFTGPIFDDDIRRLHSGVEIPDAFYRIYLDRDPGGQPRVLAFIVPQDVRGDEPLNRFVASVDEIERQTGFDFLSALEDGVELQLESSPADAAYWRLSDVCCLPPRY